MSAEKQIWNSSPFPASFRGPNHPPVMRSPIDIRKFRSAVAQLLPKAGYQQPARDIIPATASHATLVVAACAICNRHGTGALLANILKNERSLLVFYSRKWFGENELGRAFYLPQDANSPADARNEVEKLLHDTPVSRILCVPYVPDDVLSALAASDISGAPIALYIMDDQNIYADGISDGLMRELIERSSVCFAISEPLRAAYHKKYGRKFWFLPPTASENYFVRESVPVLPTTPRRGILIGNLWTLDVLDQFRKTIRESSLELDWYGNAGRPFVELDKKGLADDGIHLHAMVSEERLVQLLREADYAIVPSAALQGNGKKYLQANASFPSRIVYMMTTANLPIVVLGNAKTAAAQFVVRLGLGTVTPYDARAFAAAVREVTDPVNSARIRRNAMRLSPTFRVESVAEWIWESMKRGKAIDSRYEQIFRKFQEKSIGSSTNMSKFLPPLNSISKRFKQLVNAGGATISWPLNLQAQLQELSHSISERTTNIEKELAGIEKLLPEIEKDLTGIEKDLAGIEKLLAGISQAQSEERAANQWRHDEMQKRISQLKSDAQIGIPWLTDDPSLINDPEFLLIAHLYNFLPSRVAVDVGANDGRLSALLLDTGYQVFAFEPFPPVAKKLLDRLGANPALKFFEYALGSEERSLPFYTAVDKAEKPIGDESLYNTFRPHFVRETIEFQSQLEIQVRTLASLIAKGEVPRTISVLKIDTEGFDLEVIRGLGDTNPPVVETEFWGDEFLFMRHETEHRPFSSQEIISEMRARGYWWNLIIFRIDGEYAIRFAANLGNSPKRAWGNIFFFQQFELFSVAFRWCQSALPRLQHLSGSDQTS